MLDADALAALSAAASEDHFRSGELLIDAFTNLTVEVFVVVMGQVDLWNNADRITEAPDERLGPGGSFGFSAMLTERSVGPRVLRALAEIIRAG